MPTKQVDSNIDMAEDETLEFDALAKRHVHGVIEQTNGKIHGPLGVGELLSVNPNTLRYKIKKLANPLPKLKKTIAKSFDNFAQ